MMKPVISSMPGSKSTPPQEMIQGANAILNEIKEFQGFDDDQELAAPFDVARSTISYWRTNDEIHPRYASRIAYLRTTKLSDEKLDLREAEAHYGELERATRDPQLVYVPFLNVTASAGGGYNNDEYETPHKFLAFGKEWIEGTLGDDHSFAAAIKVIGDSMEPRLRAGDVVLVNTKVRAIQPGRVMIVWTAKDGLKVKRVSRRDGTPWATSDNLETSEKPAEFPFEERDLRGLVFWHGGEI